MSKYGESGFNRVDELNLKIIDELGEIWVVNVKYDDVNGIYVDDDTESMCKGCYENDFDQSGNKAWSEILVIRKLKREWNKSFILLRQNQSKFYWRDYVISNINIKNMSLMTIKSIWRCWKVINTYIQIQKFPN